MISKAGPPAAREIAKIHFQTPEGPSIIEPSGRIRSKEIRNQNFVSYNISLLLSRSRFAVCVRILAVVLIVPITTPQQLTRKSIVSGKQISSIFQANLLDLDTIHIITYRSCFPSFKPSGQFLNRLHRSLRS